MFYGAKRNNSSAEVDRKSLKLKVVGRYLIQYLGKYLVPVHKMVDRIETPTNDEAYSGFA